MGTANYRFRNFRLHPVARELFRDGQPVSLPASAFDCLVYLVENRHRPVERDELIGAVWGRADISENLLAQTIVRLRRVLDDTGSEQHSIRTIARVGYRWTVDTHVEAEVPAGPAVSPAPAPAPVADVAAASAQPAAPVADEAPPAAMAPARPVARRQALVAAFVLAALILAGSILWMRSGHVAKQAALSADATTTMVLPAELKATGDWEWLRYGLMDLVSNRLARAGLPVMPSGSVMAMLKETSGGKNLAPGAFRRLQPRVLSHGKLWSVALDLQVSGRPALHVEAEAANVLAATREATDKLLAALDRKPPPGPPVADSHKDAQDELLQRVSAARLAGQLPLARSLIEQAPEDLRRVPDVAYERARLQCDFGEREVCRQALEALVAQLDVNEQPALRGKVLQTLALVYESLDKMDMARSIMDEAIALLKSQSQPEVLAQAYLSRSWMNTYAWRLDEAAADIGLARAAYALSGNALGVARAEFFMGLLEERRMHPDAALASQRRAAAGFERLGMRSMLPVTLDAATVAQRMLLEFADELKTTDGFWPPEAHVEDLHMQLELAMARAIALADNGRLAEASALVDRVLRQADPAGDAGLVSLAREQQAQGSFWQGDYPAAEAAAGEAMTSSLEDDDRRDYAQTWLLKMRAMQQQGKTAEAGAELSRMQAWLAKLGKEDAWCALYLSLAEAEQAMSLGRQEPSLRAYRTAMDAAEALDVPALRVEVGQSYAQALIELGMLERAQAISGNLQAWAGSDMRVPWVQAQLYAALGKAEASRKALARARQLAGERKLPALRDVTPTPVRAPLHDAVAPRQ